jgi:Ser/Thr protein kinase RdoA (MazF antagonist)
LNSILDKAVNLYNLDGFEFDQVAGHDGGRNLVYVCRKNEVKEYVLRISALGDRREEEYLAETEFVHFLAENNAPVADVIPSKNGKLVEILNVPVNEDNELSDIVKIDVPFSENEKENRTCFVSLFKYAKGILLWENGYRYREGAPISELFYNMGKTIGVIHRLSKSFNPKYRRAEYFDKYNMEYIGKVIPDDYSELKKAISTRLEEFRNLPMDKDSYGLVHFDFSDGNYHVDMSNGNITTFDFDNCIYCWYMFDLAHLWTHGVGWCQFEPDGEKRLEYMKNEYFAKILEGYRSETDVPGELLDKLTLFIDMVLIEGVVDEFECAAREGEEPDPEDIDDYVKCLIEDIPYAGVGVDL